MLLRDTIIEPKLIEKARLITDLPTHHRRALLISSDQQESSFCDSLNLFFDSIDPKRTSALASRHHVMRRPTVSAWLESWPAMVPS